MMLKAKNIATFLTFTLLLGVGACAHKSGHKRKNRTATQAEQPAAPAETPPSENRQVPQEQVEQMPVADHSREPMSGSEIFERYDNAVFMIFTTDGNHTYQGSGFFINNGGLAVSNYHVFKGTGIGMEHIKLPGSDKEYKVTQVYAKSEKQDFILFQVDCDNTDCIPIAATKPKVGARVYAIGSPLGLENTFSSGEVSQWRAENVMQINAQIDHGSSGGALINEYGEVVGITSGTFADGSQANLNYAWSIDVIKPYLYDEERMKPIND